MKGAIRIAQFANIPVFVHWSFSLVLTWIGYISWREGATFELVLWSLSFVGCIFLCVILHEYGHALTARRFGVETRDIILLPIGGLARLEGLPENPMHEFYVAIAGPMVNVAIVLLLSPYFFLSDFNLHDFQLLFNEEHAELQLHSPFQFLIPFIVMTNIVLACFNMLPAFPMDGGRVLRSLLSIRFGRVKATQIASLLGQAIAIFFIIYGIYNINVHPVLVLVGIFVFTAATYEYKMVKANADTPETILQTDAFPAVAVEEVA